ncbi:conserved hypothetical protein [Ricinus communis]|uniref:Uncharacterized protein n=1 Tax=Ricinus communis TaxID=3988 RepID=B9SXH7_RICCO|nr:conserved hypothetical protein [Ricinus communis]
MSTAELEGRPPLHRVRKGAADTPQMQWTPPNVGFIKLKTDAAFDAKRCIARIAIVAQDHVEISWMDTVKLWRQHLLWLQKLWRFLKQPFLRSLGNSRNIFLKLIA